MNNHARRPALGELVHWTSPDGARCRAAIVTELGVGPDGRQTALHVFCRTGSFTVDAAHDEDAAAETFHFEGH